MDSDDRTIGRVLTRREILALFGGSTAAMLAACGPNAVGGSVSATPAVTSAVTAATGATNAALPSCIVRPALTEGPYFVDEKLDRSDIRESKPGTPLTLTFNVSKVSGGSCAALTGAQVDVWHCDAAGVYSDATDPSFNTKGQRFLRGYQRTDQSGRATFQTIYPGWYQGRAVHIHFKIRTTAGGQTADFTSQLFFDDALSAQVFATAPYAQRGSGWLKNAQDGIYTGGGDKLLAKPVQSGAGYAVSFDIGLAS